MAQNRVCLPLVSLLSLFIAGILPGDYSMSAEKTIDPLLLHKDALVADCHADTVLRMMKSNYHFKDLHDRHHVDLPRMRKGG